MASATLTTSGSTRRRPRGADCDEGRLFGDEAVSVAAPAPAPVAAPVAPAASITLADRLADAWEGLVSGRAASCLVCGSEMAPRWSAGAGVVGGRCGGCGTTLE